LLGSSCAQEGVEGEKKQVQRQTTSVLRDWKRGRSVSAELKGIQFSEALATLQRQTGVTFAGKANESKITLSVRNVPFWKAVNDLSVAAKASFDVSDFGGDPLGNPLGDGDPKVEFIPSFPACQRYQLVGPFHIGLWHQGTKEEPAVSLQASSLITEGKDVSRGIRNVVLKNPKDQKTVVLKCAKVLRPSKSIWVIPQTLVAHHWNLRGEIECQVYYEPHEIRIPLKETTPFEFKEFGGGKVSVSSSKDGEKVKLGFSIDWDIGLGPEDANTLKEFRTQLEEVPSIEKAETILDWIAARSGQLRLLHVQKMDLRDRNGKSIPLLGGNLAELLEPQLRGTMTFEKQYAPQELRIGVCERKPAIAVFEFENVFPR